MSGEKGMQETAMQLTGPWNIPNDLSSTAVHSFLTRSTQENQRENIRYSTKPHDLGDKRNQLYSGDSDILNHYTDLEE